MQKIIDNILWFFSLSIWDIPRKYLVYAFIFFLLRVVYDIYKKRKQSHIVKDSIHDAVQLGIEGLI